MSGTQRDIERIAVCGAGVMGSRLAALFASAGFEVSLFDLSRELSESGIETAAKARPAAFYAPRFKERIEPLEYESHLDRLETCGWVVEAIAENLEWKHELYGKIAPHLRPDAILTSNTSGLLAAELAAALPSDLQRRFLITHFFNPPRYMRLVEIVPGPQTEPEVVDRVQRLIGETLGKGLVTARDTPNFIGNRIGIFGMLLALKLTERMRLTVEQVDALTGTVMGRPKSATYRTADIVGLDTLAAVARTALERCTDDEQHEMFAAPPVLTALLEKGWLGQKSGKGFYQKRGKEILALDFDSLEYRPKTKPRMDGIGVALRFKDIGRRLDALVYNPDPAGTFAWELISGSLVYAANRVGEIADSIVEIDRALRWGFGWELGPFEVWDAIGVERSVRRLAEEGKPVPQLVGRLLDSGRESFYTVERGGPSTFFDLATAAPRPVTRQPGTIVLADQKAQGREILRNWSASLIDLGDGVACLEFHSALQPDFNPIDGAILDLLDQSLETIKRQGFDGLVVSHDGTHFCAGANLAMILELARNRRFEDLELVSRTFQELTQRIKYAPFPVVAAPFSLCLGGGFEMVAPCRQIVALAELYCGTVETGVGLIPGAGGTLRVLTHLAERYPTKRFGPTMAVLKAFETIAFAKVSGSAHEARELGYLRQDNRIVLSRSLQIALAKRIVRDLADRYRPPEPPVMTLPGRGARLAISTTIKGYRLAGKISEHDALIGNGLAHVLTGGSRASVHEPLEEQYLLDLERELFVSLAGERKSQDRMAHMLKTGKPLRN